MVSWLRSLSSRDESGQAMILVAILSAALMGITGLAIEGGRVLVEERHMQVAADMAALVGAQEAGCSVTNTTCINNAKQYACNYAQDNGFGGGWDATTNTCLSSGGTTVTVDIPPATCSPYSLDYGNGKTPSNNCGGTSTAGHYDYVEVEVDQNLGTAPIFNVSVRPHVHAVARKGTQSPRDFAIAVLDPSLSGALTFSGSATGGSCGVCVVGSVMSNSSAADSINTGGQGLDFTCGGEWYTASTTETTYTTKAANLRSYEVGGSLFSPPGCSGTQDATTSWNWGQDAIPDPYGSPTANPPPTTGTWANCTPCSAAGHYYHWTDSQTRSGGTWDDNGAGTPSNLNNTHDSYELFPGQYPHGLTLGNGNVYFNPGVYNLGTDGLKVTAGGNTCVFGAPICDEFASGSFIPGYSPTTCGTASMNTSSSSYVPPSVWYYYCSSWGTWDTSPPAGNNASLATALGSEAPKFTNGTTPTSHTLNGVSFYTYNNGSYTTGGSIKITGSGVESLAFPNPCPGTGTGSTHSVPFQSTMGTGASGDPTAVYTYLTGPALSSLGSSPAGVVYPSADLTVDGENACRAALNGGDTSGRIPDVWPGEFSGSGQLLHFLFFMRDATASIDLEGSGTQIWWGILYNPGNYATSPYGCAGQPSGCLIKLAGSSGGTGDLPMVLGQIVGDGASVGGSSTIEVFYRPCDSRTSNCQLGPGSTLIQ